MLVSKGFGDVSFNVNGEEVEGVKSIISSQNQTLSAIINDEKASSIIPISERIKINSFKMLLRYYGYGKIILTDENVCNLLYCCLCYNEMNLSNICKEYILNHLSINLVINLLKNLEPNLIESDNGEFKIKIESFIRDNSIRIFCESKSLSLSVDKLDYINSISDVVQQTEGFSLQNISKYYHNTLKKICEKKEESLINKIKELSSILDENYISYKKMNEEDLKNSVESDLQSFVSNCNLLLFARSYLDIPMLSNEKVCDIIMNLYSCDVLPIELKEEEKNILKNCNDLNDCLLNLMKKDIHGLKLGLMIIIDCGIKLDIDERTKFVGEYQLMSEYLESKKENEKILCCKCLCYFVDTSIYITYLYKILDETMNRIEKICGKDMIDKMKSFSSILPENQQNIIESY